MKKMSVFAVAVVLLSSSLAMADVTLTNKDSDKHDISIKCSSSTTQTSIGGGTTRSIGNGPCTVTVKSTGSSATASDGQKIVIQGGSPSAN